MSFGFETIYDGAGASASPYLTRLQLGPLRLHIFHRGDLDPDCHDHPADFWTFPLTPYVEEVVVTEVKRDFVRGIRGISVSVIVPGSNGDHRTTVRRTRRQVVRAFRLHHRPAEYAHRVLGRYDNGTTRRIAQKELAAGARISHPIPQVKPGRIVTIVWKRKNRRFWGFWKHRAGKWCWTPWRAYVAGARNTPCQED